MALPINEVPKYTTKLPSTGENITYRPFLVKEQKIMLTAIESENDDEIASAVNETLQSCLLNTKIDVRDLPIFDFEYLLDKLFVYSSIASNIIQFSSGIVSCRYKDHLPVLQPTSTILPDVYKFFKYGNIISSSLLFCCNSWISYEHF